MRRMSERFLTFFAKDRKGREWDYCILVTNEEKLDLTALSQLYRSLPARPPN